MPGRVKIPQVMRLKAVTQNYKQKDGPGARREKQGRRRVNTGGWKLTGNRWQDPGGIKSMRAGRE